MAPRAPDRSRRLALAALLALVALGPPALLASRSPAGEDHAVPGDAAVDFARDIRPIFASQCYECHGEKKQKAGLRLDSRAAALGSPRSVDTPLIVEGQSAQSLLYQRVMSADPDERMPFKAEPLSPREIGLLRDWIDQGARWTESPPDAPRPTSDHWAFKNPVRPALPAVAHGAWVRNPIDRFVLARLEKEGIAPSPEADRTALIRRVSFDLTGLPPTLEEIDAFVADASPQAYEKVVDRRLASPAYGERMAQHWLDLARYADTNGYHIDNHRDMWKWREWVIQAFDRNERFDQFTIEQLAGDLLPEATLEQKIATGFNRNGPINFEGGADPDEYQTKYVVDRVNTTATVWMGLTMACAECHDHKYDPIKQREFYAFYAFFNNVAEKGLDGEKTNPVPSLALPDDAQKQELAQLDGEITAKERTLVEPDAELDAAQAQWEREIVARLPPPAQWKPLDLTGFISRNGSTLARLDDGSILASGLNPATDVCEVVARPGAAKITALRLEALTHPSFARGGAGRAYNANFVLSGFEAEVFAASDPAQVQRVRFASAQADLEQTEGGFLVTKAIDDDASSGWAVAGYDKAENREAVFVPQKPIELGKDDVLRIRLRHESPYKQHGIGRFRLSSTDDAQYESGADTIAMGRWWSVGPFNASGGEQAFHTVFGPEEDFAREIDLSKTYLGGALAWREHKEWDDGQVHKLSGENCATYLYRTFTSPEARPLLLLLGSDDALEVWFNGQRVLSNDVRRAVATDQDRVRVETQAGPNRILLKITNYAGESGFAFASSTRASDEIPGDLAMTLRLDAAKREDKAAKGLVSFYRRSVSPRGREIVTDLEAKKKSRAELSAKVPQTMVMEERTERRMTNVLLRGDFQRKGDGVEAGVPAIFPPLHAPPPAVSPPLSSSVPPPSMTPAPADRLALARWLVSDDHPLTARVTVNRWWQMLFGTGLVKTSEDFGARGERPSHPELLDWLAVELRESGWDVKAMLRLLVTSAAYRQSSRVTKALEGRDPDNRLIARGPRLRLDAEMVRDNALAVSGLLVAKLGGPSVRPYQPDGLWEAVSFSKDFSSQFYEQDHGEALYRRGLYVYWKRALPYPSLATFDAPIRETCTPRRPVTDTPLQALVLLNDPTYVEAARNLALRMLALSGADDARLAYGFRLCTSRAPSAREMAVLRRARDEQMASFRADPAAAKKVLAVGESKPPADVDAIVLAAWTQIASLLLNLDETLHRG